MLVGRVQASWLEEWWSELEKGPSHKQSSVWPVVLTGDLAGCKGALVWEVGSLIRARVMREAVDGGGNVDGEGLLALEVRLAGRNRALSLGAPVGLPHLPTNSFCSCSTSTLTFPFRFLNLSPQQDQS